MAVIKEKLDLSYIYFRKFNLQIALASVLHGALAKPLVFSSRIHQSFHSFCKLGTELTQWQKLGYVGNSDSG